MASTRPQPASRPPFRGAILLVLGSVGLPWAALGCGAYSRPAGTETLAQIQVVVGAAGSKANYDCSIDHDASACGWISAFWNADYADAEAKCASGDVARCTKALYYAGGCEMRGTVSGRDTYATFDEDGGGPTYVACHSHGFPPNLVSPPPENIAKGLEYLATACRHGDKDSCGAAQDAANNGMLLGLPLRQDFEAAKTFCLAWKPTALRTNPDGCDDEGRRKETAAERSARFARVAQVFGSLPWPTGSSPAAGGGGKSGHGTGFGMTEDLSCAAAKLTAVTQAGCSASAPSATCSCTKAGVQFVCQTDVLCP